MYLLHNSLNYDIQKINHNGLLNMRYKLNQSNQSHIPLSILMTVEPHLGYLKWCLEVEEHL